MLQLIGTKKDKATRSAERFLKERRIPYQFIDLNERALSKKELDTIFSSIDVEILLNRNSKYYLDNGYAFRVFDEEEEIRSHQELLTLPILRTKTKATLTLDEKWIRDNQ